MTPTLRLALQARDSPTGVRVVNNSSTEQLNRVRLTLAGLADASGRIERWSASDAYGIADLPRDDFERGLAVLEHNREITIDRSRSRRRFELSSALRALKADGDRFVADAKRGVSARTVLIENISVVDGTMKRLRFDVTIEGLGTIFDCVLVLGEKPFVAGPSRREGAKFKTLVRLERTLAQDIRLALERRIAADPQLLL